MTNWWGGVLYGTVNSDTPGTTRNVVVNCGTSILAKANLEYCMVTENRLVSTYGLSAQKLANGYSIF